MNKNRFRLLLLILIAFALRLTLLDKQSLWYDEAVTWLLSQMQLPDLFAWTAADIQPPLYYLLIWSSEIVFGDSEWALRFPSAFFDLLSVSLIYVLAARLFPRTRSFTAFLAAALFTLSPVMIYYSQEARMYTLLVFEAILAGYLLVKILPPGIGDRRQPEKIPTMLTEDRRSKTEDRGPQTADRPDGSQTLFGDPIARQTLFALPRKLCFWGRKIGGQAAGVRPPRPPYKGRFFENRFEIGILAKKIGGQSARVRPPQPPTGGSRGQSSDFTHPRAPIHVDFSSLRRRVSPNGAYKDRLFYKPSFGDDDCSFGSGDRPPAPSGAIKIAPARLKPGVPLRGRNDLVRVGGHAGPLGATSVAHIALPCSSASQPPPPAPLLPRSSASQPPHSPAPPPSHSPALPFLYAFTAAAALYTHYFTAFLLIAHILYAGWLLRQAHWPKTLLRQTVVMFGLTALLFAPWLPTLVARLGDDPSYRPGALKLGEAIRKILITFSLGETVFEQTGFRLMLVYAGLCLAGGVWLIIYNRLAHPPAPTPQPSVSEKQAILFLFLWLTIPLLLILTLVYQTPKFNPRYTLLAYPAFLLLLTALLTKLHTASPTPTNAAAIRNTQYAIRLTSYVLRPTFYVTLLFSLTISLFSLANWFTDPRFAKDDFRALAQFVHERIGPDETVLLSSGHLFPAWAYYDGWDNWTPLPWMQRLDVNRVTDLSIAADIAAAVEGKTGVWLVRWQDEVIDPTGVVPFWLDRIGRRPDDAGDFQGVRLEHWRLDPDDMALLHQDPIVRPVDANFAGQIDLVGLTQLSDTDLALFWRPRRPLPDNLVISLDLTDKDGFDWDRDTTVEQPGGDFYPPSRWPAGHIVMTRRRLPWQIGTPPGLYLAEIGVGQADPAANAAGYNGWDILDEQGRPQRRTALLDFINLSRLVQPDGEPLPIAADPLVDFLPIVAVRRSILPQKTAEPGDRLLLALLWQAGEFNLDDVSVAFDLVDAAGSRHRVGFSLTPSRRYNLYRWKPGQLVLGQYWLDIPPETAPGSARLNIHLINDSGFFYDELFPLDDLEILPTERTFTSPTSVDIPIEANFSDQAALIGVDCQPAACRVAPGDSVALTFYWQAVAPFAKNYTVFTHLLGSDETVLLNADHAPPKPTQGWVAGEIVADPVVLQLPPDLPAGDYRLEVGFYDATEPTFPRLPLDSGETRAILELGIRN